MVLQARTGGVRVAGPGEVLPDTAALRAAAAELALQVLASAARGLRTSPPMRAVAVSLPGRRGRDVLLRGLSPGFVRGGYAVAAAGPPAQVTSTVNDTSASASSRAIASAWSASSASKT